MTRLQSISLKVEPRAKWGDPCIVCGGPRRRPRTKRHLAEAERDPFCSTTCARVFHELDSHGYRQVDA